MHTYKHRNTHNHACTGEYHGGPIEASDFDTGRYDVAGLVLLLNLDGQHAGGEDSKGHEDAQRKDFKRQLVRDLSRAATTPIPADDFAVVLLAACVCVWRGGDGWVGGCVQVNVCVCVCMYVCVCVCVCVCACIYKYRYIHICMYVCIHIYIYICIYIYISLSIYM